MNLPWNAKCAARNERRAGVSADFEGYSPRVGTPFARGSDVAVERVPIVLDFQTRESIVYLAKTNKTTLGTLVYSTRWTMAGARHKTKTA